MARRPVESRLAAVAVILFVLAAAAVVGARGAAPSAHGQMSPLGAHVPNGLTFGQTFTATTATPVPCAPFLDICYGPQQLRTAYGLQPLVDAGYDGSGRTIAIVDAYGSPTLETDLAAFEDVMGLPAADFQQVAPYGVDTPPDPGTAAGWARETTFDVEWSHGIAPGAKIRLVVAKSTDDADLIAAIKYAIDNNLGDVLSMSFGNAEQCMTQANINLLHSTLRKGVSKGMTLVAATGDWGPAQFSCDGSGLIRATPMPATDPNVTAVGGTDLVADPATGAYGSESAWNETELLGGPAAGGGGPSTLFRRPGYQVLAGVRDRMREIPDVSYNASFFHTIVGLLTSPVDGRPHFTNFAGTSAGAPQWAGVVAIWDQVAHRRLGNVNPALYLLARLPGKASPFHDIADGSDTTVPDFDGGTIQGYTAVRGYDMATGLGSPNLGALARLLAKLPSGTTPED